MPKLSIIIPIYNEDSLIASSLPLIFLLPLDKEVLVINDGSTDNTLAVLNNLKNKFDFVLINQESNQGKGAAIKRGLKDATGLYFIICDADLEYDPQDIIYLLQEIEKINLKTEIKKIALYGSRFLNSHSYTFHYLINKFLTFLTNLLFSSQLTDMETCFKLIPSEALKKIKLRSKRFEFEPEITAQLLKNDYKIQERPISYKRRNYQEGKKIKAKDGFLAIYTLFRERFSK